MTLPLARFEARIFDAAGRLESTQQYNFRHTGTADRWERLWRWALHNDKVLTIRPLKGDTIIDQEEKTSGLDPHQWRIVLAPWTFGGKLYTYLAAPGLQVGPSWIIMVEGPKGQPKFLTVEEVREYEPLPFPCKAICNAWQGKDYAEAQKTDTPLSMHEDYPLWRLAAADLQSEEPSA